MDLWISTIGLNRRLRSRGGLVVTGDGASLASQAFSRGARRWPATEAFGAPKVPSPSVPGSSPTGRQWATA